MESIEVVELFTQIDTAIEQENDERSLRLVLANFDVLPDPAPLRERVARLLARRDQTERAVGIYERVGSHYLNAGHPSRVLAVIKEIERLGAPPSGLLDRFTALYNVRSPFLDESRRHAGLGVPDEPLQLDPDVPLEIDDNLVDEATRVAMNGGTFVEEPADDLPPLPLLSQLTSDLLETVVRKLEYQAFDDLTPLEIRDDAEHGLVWTVSADLTLGADDPTYHLRPGTLLGLDQFADADTSPPPEVHARSGSKILRLSRTSVEELAETMDGFGEALDEAARRAYVEALLEGHSMFEVIPKDKREDLLERLDGLEVPEGTRLVKQSTPSPGLFLIVDGEVDIVREDDDWEITIETLGPGEVFGEVGLVSDRATPADVVMTKDGHILHLPSPAFETVAAAQPELAKWAVNLAQERISELESTLSAQDLAEISE